MNVEYNLLKEANINLNKTLRKNDEELDKNRKIISNYKNENDQYN